MKFRSLPFVFTNVILSLTYPFKAFADIAAPSGIQYLYEDGTPFQRLYRRAIVFVFATLLFELPVFYFLGFKSKKALSLVTLANIISVSAFHTLILNGDIVSVPQFVIAELLIVIFESLFFMSFLQPELSKKRIALVTLLANVFSGIVGTLLVRFILISF